MMEFMYTPQILGCQSWGDVHWYVQLGCPTLIHQHSTLFQIFITTTPKEKKIQQLGAKLHIFKLLLPNFTHLLKFLDKGMTPLGWGELAGGHPEKQRAPSRNGFWVASLPRAGNDRERRSSVTPSFLFLKFKIKALHDRPTSANFFPLLGHPSQSHLLETSLQSYRKIWRSTMRARPPILCRWIQFLCVTENWAKKFEQWSSCTRWWIEENIEDDDTQGFVRCRIPFVFARCEWLLTLAWWILFCKCKISSIKIVKTEDWICRNFSHPWIGVTQLSIELLKRNLTVP